jgi:hypothetical protein
VGACTVMDLDLFIGIDYSGAQTPTSRLKGLRVYIARAGEEPQQIKTPAIAKFLASGSTNPNSVPRYWTRSEIAHWLVGLAKDGVRYLAGIDHAFSFPESYFIRYGLTGWPQFLVDFCHHWPTDEDHVYVDFIRDGSRERSHGWPPPDARIGSAREYRLCDRRARTAKSVFHFDVQGSVAKSTHAGIPWLRRIRETAGARVHFWPFDGWQPSPGRAVIAEVYPSLFRKVYPKEDRTDDEHDAYAVARWLSETTAQGALDGHFNPALSAEDRRKAGLEGWILGVG